MDSIVTGVLPLQETRERQLDRLCRRYPFLSRSAAGKSVLGHELTVLKLGDSDDAVLYAGGFHGCEWLTTLLLMTFVERLCEALETGDRLAGIDCRRALLGRGLLVMPCVNPDGTQIALCGCDAAGDLRAEVRHMSGCPLDRTGVCDIAACGLAQWKANARGVDINHNFDAGWHILRQLEEGMGISGPAPARYGGAHPESEPETRALTQLCERVAFRYVLAFHSQGEEIYWQYGDNTPARSSLMARVMAMSSGYTLAEPERIASHGGFKDWFIERHHRPGFTLEIGRGRNPLPLDDLTQIYDRLEELLMLSVYM